MKSTYNVENLHGLDISLQRISTTIEDCKGKRQGEDEVVLCVPRASEYDTDFIQNDCAILHFSPRQAKTLAFRLLKLSK